MDLWDFVVLSWYTPVSNYTVTCYLDTLDSKKFQEKIITSTLVNQPMNKDIDECIKAIRTRMQYGHSKQEISEGLGRHFPQDLLFLCYHAAKILEDAAKQKK